MHAHAVTLVALLSLAAVLPAAAQPRDGKFLVGARAPQAAAVSPATAPAEEVDESALRYYASLRQTDRVEAETQRLRRLYPHWQPPGDLYRAVEPGGAEEEELWALFALDKITELRTAIEDRKAQQPGWKPSRDLSGKLARKELRHKMISLSSKSETETLIAFVKSTAMRPEELDLDMQWLLAETYAKAKQTQEALALYQLILRLNTKAQERIATIQKAMASLPMSQVETLLGSAADPRAEFAAIWPDITRARISAFLQEDRSDEVPPADVAALAKAAASS